MMPPHGLLSRRMVLTVLGAAATLAPAGGWHAAAQDGAPGTLDLSVPEDLVTALWKLRGTLDDRLVYGWLSGTRYAVVDAEVRPLMGMRAGTFSRFSAGPDGTVVVKSFELAFYTDVETGALLDTLTMPFTGKTVTVPPIKLGPSLSFIKPVLADEETVEFAAPGATSADAMAVKGTGKVATTLGPAVEKDGRVTIDTSLRTAITPAPGAPTTYYNEMVSYSGPADAVRDPNTVSAPLQVGYTGITSWRPWMEMGDTPGHTTSHAIGGKAFSPDDLPADYADYCKRFYPDEFGDPDAVLAQI